MIQLIPGILIILAAAAFFTWISGRMRIPSVVALIILGLVIGFPSLRELIIGPHEYQISALGDIGLLALMFLAGVKSSRHLLNSKFYSSLAVMALVKTLAFPFVITPMIRKDPAIME